MIGQQINVPPAEKKSTINKCRGVGLRLFWILEYPTFDGAIFSYVHMQNKYKIRVLIHCNVT